MRAIEQIGEFTAFSLGILNASWRTVLRPRTLLLQSARFVAGSVPIVLAIGVSLGLVAWMHVGAVLQRFESEQLLPTLLMTAVVLEFGPVSVGLLAASRLASGLAAEIAAMKATEQIDALRCSGVEPVERLLAPRVFACVLVLPPLTVLIDFAALMGSFAAEQLGGGLTWSLYYRYSLDQLRLAESVLATGKTAVFGLLVGLISCWRGMRTEPGAESVGQASTQAVVSSMLAVLVSNVFLVRLIQLLTGAR